MSTADPDTVSRGPPRLLSKFVMRYRGNCPLHPRRVASGDQHGQPIPDPAPHGYLLLSPCLSCPSPRLPPCRWLDNCLGTISFLLGRWRTRTVRSQLEKSDYHFVLFLGELVNGASCGFAHHTVSDGLLEFRSYSGVSESLHHCCKRVHELLHEVLDAACSTAQMPLQALAHHTPAKSGSVTDSGVGFLDAQHVLFDQIEHFSVQCCL